MSSDLPGTRISLLNAMERDAREHSLIALGVFYERYRHGLASLLITRYRLDPQEANDVLHDFLYEKMVDASLIHSYLDCLRQPETAHRAFRPYLVRALCNFTIDRLRRRKNIGIDESPKEEVLGSEYTDLYTLQWAQDILTTAFQRTRCHYLDRQREQDWILFVVRWIEPLIMGQKPPSYDHLAMEYGFDHAKQVGNALTNVLRTFKQKWKEALIEEIGRNDKQALADAIREARLSVRMAKYIDLSRLLNHAMQKGPVSPEQMDLPSCHLDESKYRDLIDLATDGFDQLLPIEQSLLFESQMRAPIGVLLETDSSFHCDEKIAEQALAGILTDPTPDLECLELLARHLKRSIRSEGTSNIPASIAGVLRFALIALADSSCNRSITSVPAEELATAMSNIVELPWIDETCRNLIKAYLSRHALSSSSDHSLSRKP